MSGWRKTDERPGVLLTMWRPLTDEDGGPSEEGADETEPMPRWCMARGCLAPLGSRYIEHRVIGHDRASCGPSGRGGPEHTWRIRRIFLCQSCYLAALEREVGAGWNPQQSTGADRRRTGRGQGNWDD